MLEIEATIPEEEAISKNVSGVVSPSPNLPRETEEKTANGVLELSYISRSAVKEAPFLNSHCLTMDCSIDLEATPVVPQLSPMKAAEAT